MNRGPYRRRYSDQPEMLDRVFSLLDLAFPGLPARARAHERFGFRWDQVSTPFLLTYGNQPFSHVGVLEMPMVLRGCEMLVGGVHAVCTHPDHRQRGYLRAVMNEALAWCDGRYRSVILMAGSPELYEKFGFQTVRESRFVISGRQLASEPGAPKARQLDPHQKNDLRLLRRLLDERAPVSRRLGVVRERWVFLFNQATKPIWYAEDLDAIFCLEVMPGTLRLYDLVAARVPTLREVIDRLDSTFERVEVYFTPDQLDAPLLPEPHVVDGDSWLMVRGDSSLWQGDLMLPRSARF